ncbi:DsbA family protein [Mangrovicella endophytica]|uniref:DsbA family protein n=1 Tax=Mangrovicella endophytica TaxID=2066697 RepID=UPI001FE1F570|nr:DsbA family protein [Mangrovicella endophytica]
MTRKLIAAALLFTTSLAAPAVAAGFSKEQTGDIETIVRDYLLRNPEVLLEAMDALEAKRNAATQAAQVSAISEAGPALTSTPQGTVLGNPDGDVTVVEFFDYNCGYCKRALGDMDALLKSDPKVRFVLKEIPVLGPQSVEASKVSLALRTIAPQRYAEFHRTLLSAPGVADADKAIGVAADLGIDEAALRKAMDDPAVAASIAEDSRLATMLQISGTPSYVIADEVVPGAAGLDVLKDKIKNVRACASASC